MEEACPVGGGGSGDVCPVTGHVPDGDVGACPVMAEGSGYGSEWMKMHNPHGAAHVAGGRGGASTTLSAEDHPEVNDFFPPDSSPYPDQQVALSPIAARSRIPKGVCLDASSTRNTS